MYIGTYINCMISIDFRIFWAIGVLGMISLLVFYLVMYAINHYQYNVVSSTKLELTNSLRFPAITVCDACPYSKQKIYTNKAYHALLVGFSPLAHMVTSNWTTISSEDLGKVSLRQLHYEASKNDSKQFIASVIWEGQRWSDEDIATRFKPVLTERGVCFTFNRMDSSSNYEPVVAKKLGFQSGLEITLKVNIDDCPLMDPLTFGARVRCKQNHINKTMTPWFLFN